MKIVYVVVPLLVTSLLSGCATTNDQDRTKAEGAGLGALIGGLLGYAIDRESGALIGAAVGAGAGYMVGNEVAKRKREYANSEDFLDAEIARTQEFNSTAVAYNKKLNQDIKALEKESKTLRARYDAGKVSKDMLVAKRDILQKRADENRKLEETLAAELEVQTAILAQERDGRRADDPYIARLEKEVQQLQKNLENLRDGSSQLARIDQRLSV